MKEDRGLSDAAYRKKKREFAFIAALVVFVYSAIFGFELGPSLFPAMVAGAIYSFRFGFEDRRRKKARQPSREQGQEG